MNTGMMIEIFGYIGSTLVVVSMLMASVVKLRVINTIGSVISGTYALIIGSFPLALMNGCLIAINVYNLYKLLKTEQEYDLIEEEVNDGFVNYFLERYMADIKCYFPEFDKNHGGINKAYIVCCNGNPAGILLGIEEAGTIEVVLDYAIPTYRDCSIGSYLYTHLKMLGIQKLVFEKKASDAHEGYLKKMGFVKEDGKFVKQI